MWPDGACLSGGDLCRARGSGGGGGASGEITLGERRRDASGLDSVWARGPVAAAARLVKAGRVNILGLVTRVMPLAQRRLQCFRCLHLR